MHLLRHPILVFVVSMIVLWLFSILGAMFRRRHGDIEADEREDFGFLVASSLTLLGLIIGFSFSMAIGRYDQRKNLEADEANKIGTEYIRLDFLPPEDGARSRELMLKYVDQRVLFYTAELEQLPQINATTAQLQKQLWSSVQVPASAKPSPLTALAVSGMNEVLDSQGYTQAAWWNRIPVAAWCLMTLIAIGCNFLIGYGAVRAGVRSKILLILPIVVSIAFCLIADIDSPRGGIIRVRPQNLEIVAQSLRENSPK
jgi:protein-S-isoprenylcysteine O-methyltransferase Ste14